MAQTQSRHYDIIDRILAPHLFNILSQQAHPTEVLFKKLLLRSWPTHQHRRASCLSCLFSGAFELQMKGER